MKLIFTENQIEVTANSPDVGEAQETLEVGYTGPDMQIAFNPEFLQAPLRALDTENVYLDLIDEMSPVCCASTARSSTCSCDARNQLT